MMKRNWLSRLFSPRTADTINWEEPSDTDRITILQRFSQAHKEYDEKTVKELRPYTLHILMDTEVTETEIRIFSEGMLDLYDAGKTPVDMENASNYYARAGMAVDWLLTDMLEHPCCPEDILARAARSRHAKIRYFAVTNPSCPVEYQVEAALEGFGPRHFLKW